MSQIQPSKKKENPPSLHLTRHHVACKRLVCGVQPSLSTAVNDTVRILPNIPARRSVQWHYQNGSNSTLHCRIVHIILTGDYRVVGLTLQIWGASGRGRVN